MSENGRNYEFFSTALYIQCALALLAQYLVGESQSKSECLCAAVSFCEFCIDCDCTFFLLTTSCV